MVNLLSRRSAVVSLVSLAVLLTAACGTGDGGAASGPAAAGSGEDGAFRVAVARFQHETCTFCPGGETTVEDWTRLRPPLEGDEVLDAGPYVRGFTAGARERGVELVGLSSPHAVFGGSSRSWNARATFEHFADSIVADLEASLPVDGVYLALHGAMAVREIPRPEAELARRVREVVGPDVPIVGTFDLHGNEDAAFLRHADAAFVTKRYPHYDAHLQGERAARFLDLTMRGDYEPTSATREPPLITATVLQWTGQSPAMDIMERARRWEARRNDVYVSVFFGYPWSDVPDVGTTVHVTTDGDQALADSIADDMSDFIWRVREPFARGDFPGPSEAVERAVAAVARGDTPVVLADYSDRPGDATWILRELRDREVGGVLYATLRDERALDSLWARGVEAGDPFDMEVGGFTGESAGEPVRIRGTLAWKGSRWGYDRVAAVRHGDGNTLILTPAYEQVTTPGEVRFGPVEPDDHRVFVLKSRVHFRRGFDETGLAREIIVTDAPGPWVGTTRLGALDYRHAPLDSLYPFGDVPSSWTDGTRDGWLEASGGTGGEDG